MDAGLVEDGSVLELGFHLDFIDFCALAKLNFSDPEILSCAAWV